jgi:hypothetical protein
MIHQRMRRGFPSTFRRGRVILRVIPPEHRAVGIFLFLLVAVACALYSAQVASSKGHDPALWFLGGFLFGPLALLATLGLPDLKLRNYIRLLVEHQGVLVEEISTAPAISDEDVDAQRRRILGGR